MKSASKLFTADKETGTFIEPVESIDQGLILIAEYELEDKRDDCYTDNFYIVVDENHCETI